MLELKFYRFDQLPSSGLCVCARACVCVSERSLLLFFCLSHRFSHLLWDFRCPRLCFCDCLSTNLVCIPSIPDKGSALFVYFLCPVVGVYLLRCVEATEAVGDPRRGHLEQPPHLSA